MGGEGACIIVAAVDERQAGIVLGIARRMVELNDELASCVQIFKDKLMIPSRGASSPVCPPHRRRLRVWTTPWRSAMRSAGLTVRCGR
jgi:hypothetical protein